MGIVVPGARSPAEMDPVHQLFVLVDPRGGPAAFGNDAVFPLDGHAVPVERLAVGMDESGSARFVEKRAAVMAEPRSIGGRDLLPVLDEALKAAGFVGHVRVGEARRVVGNVEVAVVSARRERSGGNGSARTRVRHCGFRRRGSEAGGCGHKHGKGGFFHRFSGE